jgi:hypothetical protein
MGVLYFLRELLNEIASAWKYGDARRRGVLVALALVCVVAMCLSGVSLVSWALSPPKPRGVHGTVTFNEGPIDKGEIVFDPLPGETAQRRWCGIDRGVFVLPAHEGVSLGKKYSLRIKAFRGTGKRYENADMSRSPEVVEQYLPARWNTQSEFVYEATRANTRQELILRLE